MGLRSIGGGQFRQVVEELIQLERQPIRNLEVRKAQVEQRLTLFQDFKTKMSELNRELGEISDFRKLIELKADLGTGEDLVDVVLDKDRAKPGSYEITVDQLATRSSMISNAFEDPNEPVVGMGYVVVYEPDGDSYELFIDDDHSSLRDIARKINDRRDSPIQASVVQDYYDPEKPWRLILNSKEDGYENGVEFAEFYFLGGSEDFWIDDDLDPENAYLYVNGFELEAPGNNIKDFLQGVNLHLKGARPDQPFTLTITVDNEKVEGKVKDLVDKVNGVLKFINDQNTVDETTDTRVTFTGDTGLQSIEYRIRNLLHEAFPIGNVETGDYVLAHLHDLGITFNRQGLLDFDANRFKKVVDDDFDVVADALSGENGFVNQFRSVVRLYTRPFDGTLAVKEQGIRQSINRIDTQIENQERLIDIRAKALRDKFARLEGSLGALQTQQQFVNANLGGGGGNPINQLLG